MTATLTSPPRRGAARNPGGTSPWERARLRRPLPPRPSALPTIVGRNGPVVALHQRDVIAPGGIADQAVVDGDRMVAARDLAGGQWWLPAAAVWVDAETETRPDRPRPAGLLSGRPHRLSRLSPDIGNPFARTWSPSHASATPKRAGLPAYGR